MPGGRHGLQNRRPDTLCRGVGSIPTLSANLRSVLREDGLASRCTSFVASRASAGRPARSATQHLRRASARQASEHAPREGCRAEAAKQRRWATFFASHHSEVRLPLIPSHEAVSPSRDSLVDKVLQSLGDTGLPRPIVLDVVRRELQALRTQKTIPDADAVLARVRAGLARRARVAHPAGHQRHGHSRAHEFRPFPARRRGHRRPVGHRVELQQPRIQPRRRLARRARQRISSTGLRCCAAPKPPPSSTTTPPRWC